MTTHALTHHLRILIPLAVTAALVAPSGCKREQATTATSTTAAPTVSMRIGNETFTLEIADSEAEQKRGLMYRRSMPQDYGMIFVFPDEEPRGFYMKNTYIPLDILYVNAAGRVVSIRQMQPEDESSVQSGAPAKYAIELNQGAAARAGVSVGDVLEIPPAAREPAKP